MWETCDGFSIDMDVGGHAILYVDGILICTRDVSDDMHGMV